MSGNLKLKAHNLYRGYRLHDSSGLAIGVSEKDRERESDRKTNSEKAKRSKH
jgi:hypothetical protein